MLDSIPIIRDCTITTFDGTTYYIPPLNQRFLISLMHPKLRTHKYIPDDEFVGRILIQKLVVRTTPVIGGGVPYALTADGQNVYDAIRERAIQRRIRNDWLKNHPDDDNPLQNVTIFDFDKERLQNAASAIRPKPFSD